MFTTVGSRVGSQLGGDNPRDRYPSYWHDLVQQVRTWYSWNYFLGYTPTEYETDQANILVKDIIATGYVNSISLLYAFIGNSLVAVRVPLLDLRGIGPGLIQGFTTADIGNTLGLKCSGTTNAKFIDTRATLGQLCGVQYSNQGAAVADCLGGMFWGERNGTFGTSVVEPMGGYDPSSGNRFVLDLRSNLKGGRWGQPANTATTVATTASNKHYFIEDVADNSRVAYEDGVSFATNTTNSGNSGSPLNMTIGACQNAAGTMTGWNGTSAWAGFTCPPALGSAGALAMHGVYTRMVARLGR